MGSRLENAFAYTPYARVKDDGLPGLRTMEFRTPTIRPEERAEHYSLLSEQQRISTPRLRLKSTDLDKKDPGVDKAKERKIPSAPEVGTVAPEPIKDETPRQQTGRYDDKTGKTWFDCGGKEVWADMDTLQGVGVLPDGTFVNAAKGDRFAKPVYEVIYQRDSGQISKEEADQRLDAIAWEIAWKKYPVEDVSIAKRYKLHEERLKLFQERTISYYDIPDITDWMKEVLESESVNTKQVLEEQRQTDSNSYHFVNDGFLAGVFGTGNRYDIKQWPELQAHSLFIFNGELLSRDDLGNIMYGYVTEASGVPDWKKRAGAGTQQILDGSRIGWWRTQFDDPRDYLRVQQGVELYRNQHGSGFPS